MGRLVDFIPSAGKEALAAPRPRAAQPVYVVFTTIEETAPAVEAAVDLARAMGTTVVVLHFRAVSYPVQLHKADGRSPVSTEAFAAHVQAEGVAVEAHVYNCRSPRESMRSVIPARSLVVCGGRRSWWPTRGERLRRALEAAGHQVILC
jgi:hypothetical protein